MVQISRNVAVLKEENKANYKVPFGTISLTSKALGLIAVALSRKWLTKGALVREFEEKYAKLFGVKYAVALSSGTDADAIACAVLYDFGAKRGDEIIIPALTFVATANAIMQAGFTPIFVDVEKDTLNIDPKKIERKITARTVAIMPVHLVGKPCKMDEIMRIAKKHKLYVIEDAAEAHGGQYKRKKLGTIGCMGCFSLYAAHIITSIEGGMIITNNKKMADVARSLRNHGVEGKFKFKRIGFSSKMNELEAAVGLGNLEIYREILRKRWQNLHYLMDSFKKFDDYFWYLKEDKGEVLGPFSFWMIVKPLSGFTKKQFVDYLESVGIDTRDLFYSIPSQTEGYFKDRADKWGFDNSEFISDWGLQIGCHQDLTLNDMKYVVEMVDKWLASYSRR